MSVPKDKRTEGELAIASKGNNFHLIQRMDEYYKALWAEGENNGNDSQNGYSSERDV